MKQKETVDAFMAKLDHPLKAEVQTVRDIIKAVDPAITEEVKWNAPSFSCNGYIVTFQLRAQQHVHLVFHNPDIASIQNDILEGDYPDRRMTYFSDMKDIEAKKGALESVVRELVKRNKGL
jgi:uncharacterized protein YdhG (YjbR/CyaY superfamily)